MGMLRWAGMAGALLGGLATAQINAVFVTHERVLENGQVRVYTGARRFWVREAADLEPLLARLAREARPARFVYDAARGWIAVEKVGYGFDLAEVRAAYREALEAGRTQFVLPVRVVEPEVSVADLARWGVRELLAEGRTSFRGSSAGRVHNIRLGAQKIDGTLIPPGTVFSFNAAVGPITREAGFGDSLVIVGDKTELGVGGGICQVSTTVYRAAFFAGLPIVERRAHSYQLAYYHPVGLDAAVYQPWLDLKFRNDTPGYILVQAHVQGQELVVRFFGTRDRTVDWEGPFVSDRRPPPEPRYVLDSSLPPGAVKQVDWAAEGATVRVKRTVRYADGRVVREVFTSRYRPWGAVYLVGPEPKPEPEPQAVGAAGQAALLLPPMLSTP